MHINFSPYCPINPDEKISLYKLGDRLTVNEVELDFTQLPEGGILPAGATNNLFITGSVTRKDGHVVVNVRLPIPHDAAMEMSFPQPIFDAEDGAIQLPGAA